MTDYYHPKRYLIIASIRSGGTLLSHALDSHPMIYCHRGEPVHGQNPIRKIASSPIAALDAVLSFHGYSANVAKVTWEQFFILKDELHQLKLDGVILLYRDNPLRVIVSEKVRLADKVVGDTNTHSFDSRNKMQVRIDPNYTHLQIHNYLSKLAVFGIAIPTTIVDNILTVSYEQISTDFRHIPRSIGFKLCDFLNVGYRRLEYQTVQRNPYPLSELIINYGEVKSYFQKHCPNYLEYLTEPQVLKK
jgi:hypothetical protein